MTKICKDDLDLVPRPNTDVGAGVSGDLPDSGEVKVTTSIVQGKDIFTSTLMILIFPASFGAGLAAHVNAVTLGEFCLIIVLTVTLHALSTMFLLHFADVQDQFRRKAALIF